MLWLEMVTATMKPTMQTAIMMVVIVVDPVLSKNTALNVNVLVASLEMEPQVQQLEMGFAMMKTTMQTAITMEVIVVDPVL